MMITHLLETAAQTFEVSRAALTGQCRQRHIVQARQAVAWALEAAERRAKEDPRYALRLSTLVSRPASEWDRAE